MIARAALLVTALAFALGASACVVQSTTDEPAPTSQSAPAASPEKGSGPAELAPGPTEPALQNPPIPWLPSPNGTTAPSADQGSSRAPNGVATPASSPRHTETQM
jgi:hypothetical protein